jgi:alcohol dehydrogenase class IV
MALVSLHGGFALANAKLGAVHGFAGPLGGLCGAPHGAICARLLPSVLETSLAALRARAPGSPALERYAEVGRGVTGRATATADDAVRWSSETIARLGVPTLSALGLRAAQVPEVVLQSARSSSMKGHPIVLTDDELRQTLERAM